MQAFEGDAEVEDADSPPLPGCDHGQSGGPTVRKVTRGHVSPTIRVLSFQAILLSSMFVQPRAWFRHDYFETRPPGCAGLK